MYVEHPVFYPNPGDDDHKARYRLAQAILYRCQSLDRLSLRAGCSMERSWEEWGKSWTEDFMRKDCLELGYETHSRLGKYVDEVSALLRFFPVWMEFESGELVNGWYAVYTDEACHAPADGVFFLRIYEPRRAVCLSE